MGIASWARLTLLIINTDSSNSVEGKIDFMTSSLFEKNKLPTILITLDYKRVAFVDALSSSQSPEE